MIEKENISKQESQFKVPDRYFEEFDQRLKNRINPAEERPTVSKLTMIKPWIGLAAAFLILTMIYNLIPNHILNSSLNKSSNLYESEEVEVWTDESFGIHELIDYLTIKNIATESVDIYPDSVLFSDLTHEDYIFLSHTEY
ncbi:MAG TPA: hypothetical protein VKY45_08615 [Marinilabiliaceae bacterium]|nr:hypothetical protein [Marinilabiliaceae bacterium]